MRYNDNKEKQKVAIPLRGGYMPTLMIYPQEVQSFPFATIVLLGLVTVPLYSHHP